MSRRNIYEYVHNIYNTLVHRISRIQSARDILYIYVYSRDTYVFLTYMYLCDNNIGDRNVSVFINII